MGQNHCSLKMIVRFLIFRLLVLKPLVGYIKLIKREVYPV